MATAYWPLLRGNSSALSQNRNAVALRMDRARLRRYLQVARAKEEVPLSMRPEESPGGYRGYV